MTKRSSTTAFAKSTRPEIGGVVRRDALFSRLDGTPARTIAWIAAPPGYGKTTLAATYLEARTYRWAWYEVDEDDDDAENFFHYLTHAVRALTAPSTELPSFAQEHRADLAAFSRRYFRALFAQAASPMAVVLDNVHDLGAESDLRVILEAGLFQVPRQCCVIVTSRGAPPVAMARLQASGQMVTVHVDDLKMTSAELAELAQLRGQTLAEPMAREMNERAAGWPAALVLMVEHVKRSDPDAAPAQRETAPRGLFDYFAGEIFSGFEPAMQRFLLQIACVPRITIEVARALSRNDGAARLLLNLAHNDYFVRELVGPDGRVFVVHPLLREFLVHRAVRDLPEAVGPEAQRRAARLLRDSGQPEDALSMFVQCKDWPEVAAIAAAQAEALLRQGRHATLAAWLELLPPEIVAADGALLAAHGAALAHVSPRAARRKFEEAFSVHASVDDRRGMSAACLGALDAVLREFDDLTVLDRWLAEYDRLHGGPAHAVAPPVVAARLWRNPTHPSLSLAGASRAQPAGDGRAMIVAAVTLLRGEPTDLAVLAEHEPVTASTGVALRAAEALRRLLGGQYTRSLDSARAGLDLCESLGGQVDQHWLRMLVAAAKIGLGELEGAASDVDQVEASCKRRGDRAFAHFLRGSLARAFGSTGEAMREYRAAVLLAGEVGLPWLEGWARIASAQLLLAAGDSGAADAQLRAAAVIGDHLGHPLLRLAGMFTRAAAALGSEDERGTNAAVASAFLGAREAGVAHVPGIAPSMLARLCAEALRRDIAIDHVRFMIDGRGLVPPEGALRLRRWPWRFEICSLGPFVLRRGSDPVEFSAKGPGRPVELLKVLIALGGSEVRIDTLADALWPHVDADYAHKSFTATLHRLRRMLDEEEAVRLRDGRLSLNPALFWIDGWALDHLLADIEERARDDRNAKASAETCRTLVEEALALYKGPFLLDDTEQPAYLARREQMRARLMRALARAAARWEQQGHGEVAADWYLRCIDADEQCEAFHRNLMLCYQRQGNAAEALAAYARLRTVLETRLRSVPSPETEAIRASLCP